MEYYIGQTFEGDFPNGLSKWCEENDAFVLQKGTTFYVMANPKPTLDELKQSKLTEVDQWTASKITGGFISGGVRYDSDMDTQTTMQGIALNVNTERFTKDYPHGIPVRGYDEGSTEKTIHYLTAEEVLMFCADLSEHIGRCKLDGWTMQQAVLEATTKEELEAIILD